MWILTPLQPGGETHYLLSSKEYVVGRKNCDVLLPNDQSISRVHAHLTATDRTLTVKDTSKYGTFINGQRVTENTPADLNSGDSITFGVFHSKFSVEHMQLVVCSSCLDNDGKTSLSQAVLHVGGQLVNTWTENCTHLAMPTVKVTVKTISALLCCRPIVKPEFFPALHTAVQQKSPPPKAEMFVPEIDEPSLNKEDVNVGAVSKRKELFRGKTFIFLSAKQLKRLSAAVGFGGGRCNLLKEGSLPRDLLESAQSCVVDITTGSSQTLLSPSATEWVNSVKNIVERKGLRVITESEIGLAAIYASCEKHCNTSLPDHESVPKVKPRIPSASLSQSVAVDETVLPAASQNITAYAVNTEPSQGRDICKVSGVTAVGETPEKGLNQKTKELSVARPGAKKKLDTQYFVAESLNLSYNTMEPTVSQRKTDESKLTGGNSGGFRSQPSFLKPTAGGTKTFFQKYSPQKQTPSTQASPHKQSSLTNFFQPINKKRLLEEDIPAETSEPKRPVCDYSINTVTFEETPTRSGKGLRDKSQTSQALADDPFAPQPNVASDKLSFTAQKKAHGQKRKEMEEEIDPDELESLMSEDMDCFEDPPSRNKPKSQVVDISNQQKQVCNVESSNKRQRFHKQDSERGKQPDSSKKIKEQNVCMTIDTFQPSENRTDYNKSSKPAARPSADKKQNILPLEEGEHYSVEDLVSGVPKKTTIKEEVQKSKIKDDLPKKLLLVEFRDLTVTEPSKRVSQQKQSNGYTKNFKSFRKVQMLDSAHVIRGTDLLAHNRGKNSDLDEWLKDAAEEELQSRRDESAGDDLFRYNPTKLAKRR